MYVIFLFLSYIYHIVILYTLLYTLYLIYTIIIDAFCTHTKIKIFFDEILIFFLYIFVIYINTHTTKKYFLKKMSYIRL